MQRSDFEEKGLTPETLQKALATRARWLSIQESSVQDRSYSVLRTRQFLDHLHILSLFECEHMLDRPKLIDQLCHHQIIEGNTLEGRKPVQDRAIVNGLFYCSLDDPIRDTYYALAILSQLDGLDQINREACIKGILRLHRGKGLFGSYRKQDKLHIPGDTYDTCYAFESLRLLNALDRIKDLDKWVFRPGSTQITPTLRWQQIEAWLLTEAVQTYGKDRKSNPSLKAPTLLKPGYLADH
jgi:prenyltransferase beta subunit